MDGKLKEYKERHTRWQNIAIDQLGTTSNIIFSLSVGFLAFAFDKEFLSTFSLSYGCVFSCKMFFYILSIIFLILSISCAVVLSISKLYDFKITRHINWVRYAYHKDVVKVQPDTIDIKELPADGFEFPKFKERICTFFTILLTDIKLLSKKEILEIKKDSIIISRFKDLRKLSHNLGVISWRNMKMQLLFLLISLILYSINLFC